MFDGHGKLNLERDHLDLSYHAPDRWPALTPLASLRSFSFGIGDPACGPVFQLGLVTTQVEEPLDWQHSIDPVHHHGSDQFRLLLGGGWQVASQHLRRGSYLFQEAGWIYQEHPEGDSPAFMLLVMADRRGMPATLRLARDKDTVFAAGAEYGEPLPDEQAYPHPAGHRGLAAVETSLGACRRGYLGGHADDLGMPVSGLLGDAEAGPVVHLLHGAPGETLLPAITWNTEVVLAVVEGACQVGDTLLHAGELRIQRAGAPLDAHACATHGARVALIIGDRRAIAQTPADRPAPTWLASPAALQERVQSRPGGSQSPRAA